MVSGDEINGHVFEDKIGEGSVAEVWQVRLKGQADLLAAKVLRREFCASPRIRVRFEREGEIKLPHPNIVPVLHLEVFEGRPGLVMPFYREGSLEKRIRPTAEQQESGIGKPLSLKEVFAVSREILDALNFANERQIIHRDVKPDNILFDDSGRALLTDFGIALEMKRRNVTEAGGDLGTALYGSPEQARDPRYVDHRTDVYSFGCCLFDMLTGRPPFLPKETGGDSSFDLRLAHVNEIPPSARDCNPEVPEELNDLVMTSLAKDPNDRFPGCGEFARQLRAIEQSLAVNGGSERAIKPGDRISGYVFEKKLGQGGMAEVWQVVQEGTGDILAAKVLLPEYAASPGIRARFQREGQIHLTHPNILRVLDLVEFRERPAMIMPLCRGGSLEGRLRKTPAEADSGVGNPLPLPEAFAISRQILGALDFAHQHEVIHRDVKPDNILFDGQGRAFLADFGIALDMKRVKVTEAGGELGTALYISPEQIRNPRAVDHRADVYSFGCCLYDMLAGRPPFISDVTDDAAWSFNLRAAHVKQPPPPPRQFNKKVPAELNDLVLECLAKSANDRPPGAGELAARLATLEPGPKPGPKGDGWWGEWLRRNRWNIGVAVLSASLILALIFGGEKFLEQRARPLPAPKNYGQSPATPPPVAAIPDPVPAKDDIDSAPVHAASVNAAPASEPAVPGKPDAAAASAVQTPRPPVKALPKPPGPGRATANKNLTEHQVRVQVMDWQTGARVPGLTVMVDARPYAMPAGGIFKLTPGVPHTLRFSAPGYTAREIQVERNENEKVVLLPR